MKKQLFFIAVFSAFFFGCSPMVSHNKKSIKNLFLKNLTIIYSFEELNPYFPPAPKTQQQKSYCLKNVEVLFKNKHRFPLFDSYEINFYLKKFGNSDKPLQGFIKKNILSDTLLNILPIWNVPGRESNKFPERRIGDSDYKFEHGNINGYLTISSGEIFANPNEKTKLYILFKITGHFFLYEGYNEFVIENASLAPTSCLLSEHLLNDDFLVVNRISQYLPPDEKVVNNIGLKKTAINEIRILILE